MDNKLYFTTSEAKKHAIGLIHRVYLTLKKSSRQYLASTKTRAETRGGGKKPWKQKGTGKARAGSIRSPLWVGGGVIFGPKPKVVKRKVNKKERQLATLSAFFLKTHRTILLEDSILDRAAELKTRHIRLLLGFLNLPLKRKTLFILKSRSLLFWRAAKNIKNIRITDINSVNLSAILEAHTIILSRTSLQIMSQAYESKK